MQVTHFNQAVLSLFSKPSIGITLTLIAVLLGTCTGILVKKLGDDITIFTTLFYRFLFSVPLLLGYALLLRGTDFWRINQRKILFWRIVFGSSGMLFWFLSIRSLPFGQATALFQSSVIFVTIMSPFFLGERVGVYRWSAVIAGMMGVIIITDPFTGTISIYASYGVLAAISGAVLSILLRRLGKGDEPASVALWYNGTGAAVMAIIYILLPDNFDQISGTTLRDLIVLGVIASLLQICFTTSYKYVDAVVVSSLRYVQMPLSGVFGYILFAEIMTTIEIIGATIIISSCVVIAWREMVRSRDPE